MPIQPFDTEISLGGFSTAAGVATLNGSITGLVVEEWDGVTPNPGDPKSFVGTNNIMRTDRDWKITLKWRLFGTLLDMIPPNMGMVTAELHGRFRVMAYFEGIGEKADEKDLEGDKTKPVSQGGKAGIDLMTGRTGDPVAKGSRTVANPAAIPPVLDDPEATEWQYEETFTILGQTSKTDPLFLKPGAYRVSVNLTFEQPVYDATGNITGYKSGPMAGFMELPGMIQVYDPGTF